MRKETVNLITTYQSVGAVVNFITMLFIVLTGVEIIEAVLTIAAVNACYIVLSRDWSRKQEMICTAKNIRRSKQHPNTNPIHHP